MLTLQCALETMDMQSENSKGDTETYTGVSLAALLGLAGPASDPQTIAFVASD